jgi:exodeoxyribonuclease-3
VALVAHPIDQLIAQGEPRMITSCIDLHDAFFSCYPNLSMKIATWNVNSIRARMERLRVWLAAQAPDVLCLQETKVEDQAFPARELESLGYHVAAHGQKTYNGVAVLARQPLDDIVRGFGDGVEDAQARFLVVRVGKVRVGSLYVPNGQAVGTEKFKYKLKWLARWQAWLETHADASAPLVLCGDMNVAPGDRDVHDPEAWRDQVMCHPDERAALAEVRRWGLVDVFRQLNSDVSQYTWWDYRQLSFPKNRGLRIDHILCTEAMAARCRSVAIDREARKGEAPSDHAPVIADFADQ